MANKKLAYLIALLCDVRLLHFLNQHGGKQRMLRRFFIVASAGLITTAAFASTRLPHLPREQIRADVQTHVQLPAHIHASRDFFEALARASGFRFLVSAQEDKTVAAKLSSQLGGRTITVSDALNAYRRLTASIVRQNGNEITVQGPRKSRKPTPPSQPAIAAQAGFAFLQSLSGDQIDALLKRSSVNTGWLSTPEQEKLYINFIRKSQTYDDLLSVCHLPKPLSDTEILHAPVRFYIVYTASMCVAMPGGKTSSWIGLFDYGRGVVQESEDSPPFPGLEKDKFPAWHIHAAAFSQTAFSSTNAPLRLNSFSMPSTQRISLGDLVAQLRRQTRMCIVVDKHLRDLEIVISAGDYPEKPLIEDVAQVLGLQARPMKNGIFIGVKADNSSAERRKKLRTAAEKFGRSLRGLPFPASIPLDPHLFSEGGQVAFRELPPEAQVYIRKRLATQTERTLSSDLATAEIKFANTLWWNGIYSQPGSAVYSMQYQIW